MKKIILSMMVSVDGFIETGNRDISWHNWSPEMDDYMSIFFKRVDTIILGRVAYELMASYWPSSAAEAENPLIAHKMNKLNKLVLSTTLQNTTWRNTSIERELNHQLLAQIKEQPGKDIVIFGGAKVAQAFINMDAIDEYQLIINPVILGQGLPLFSNHNQQFRKLELIKCVQTKIGNTVLHYQKT